MLPAEFVKKIQALLGREAADFFAAYERSRSQGLRLNPLKTDRPPKLDQFGLTAVPWAKDGYFYDPSARPGLSAYHEAGLYYLQEPSAMAPAELLAPEPGELVLDLCAAPGGKSTQLAARLQGRGLLVCNEIHPARAKVLSRNIERLGICNALVLNETPARLAERFTDFFDKILVDAPCSGEGMFRKEDHAVADWSPETVSLCAERQAEILQQAGRMLRPGGRLVYSTCTFSPEENESVISRFLKANQEFTIEKVDAPWFSPGRPDWVEDPAPGLERTLRLWPHKLQGEGHFAAVLRRGGAALQREGDALQQDSTILQQNGTFLQQKSTASQPDDTVLRQENAVSRQGLAVLGREGAVLRREDAALQQEATASQRESAALGWAGAHDAIWRQKDTALRQKGAGGAKFTERGKDCPPLPDEARSFCDQMGLVLPAGWALPFGRSLYWAPPALPDLKGLKVLRPGLALGQVLPGRFEPDHALALWARTAAQVQDLSVGEAAAMQYLHGEVLPGSQTGWTLITVDGLSLGWAKGSGGVLKNHYPKGLRLQF